MRRVLQLPAYRRLLAAYGLNQLAWSVGTLALAVLIYRRTGSALGSTVFFLCSQVIPAFGSPMLVVRLDQRAPRRVLPALYGLEGVLFGVLAWMTAHFSLAPVLALTLADGIVAIVARSLSRSATVGVLQPADLLHEGNAVINAVFSVCFMAGPLVGGLVVVAGGTVTALLVNCGLFAAIAVVLVTAGGLPAAVSEPEPSGGRLRAALAHVRGDRALRWLVVLQAGGLVAFTISIPVEVVFAQHSLHAGAGGYGAILSAWGAGAVVGSAAYARWRRGPARVLLALSGIALAVGFFLMAAAPSLLMAVIGAAVGGGGNGVESIAAKTAVQTYTPQRWMALVMGFSESINTAAPGAGILLGGAIAELTNPRLAFVVGGAGSVAFAVAAWVVLAPGAALEPVAEPAAGTRAAPGGSSTASESRETLV